MIDDEIGDRDDEELGLDSLVVDFEAAMVPRTDFARDLRTYADTLRAAGNSVNLGIAAESRSLIHDVSPYLLAVRDGWNARDHDHPNNRRHVLELAVSIKEKGVEEPLTVYEDDGQLFITNGHCRFLAVMYLINVLDVPVNTVPIKFENTMSSEADRISSQVVRNKGKELEPLEMARVCRQLLSHGWDIKKIAATAGKTRGRIVQLLDLHSKMTPKIERMIRNGEVKPSFVARVIRSVGQVAEAEEVLETAVSAAKAAGKPKASEKHLPMPLPSPASATPNPATAVAPSSSGDVDGMAKTSGERGNASPAAAPPVEREGAPLAPALRRVARDIFRRASIVEGDDGVTIQLSPDDYAKLRELLGIPL